MGDYDKEVWMADRTVRERLEGKELKVFCFFSMALLFAAGLAGPGERGGFFYVFTV